MRERMAQLTMALVIPAMACGHVVDAPPPAARIPLIEGVLFAGATTSSIRLRWLDSAGGGRTFPVPPTEVHLVLCSDDGTETALRPDPDSASGYLAALPIAAGHRYVLEGRIADVSVVGATTVPTSFAIEIPDRDTIEAVPSPATAEIVTVPFRWNAVGAALFVVDSAVFVPASSSSRANSGTLALERRPRGSPPGPTLTFVALNRDAERYLYGGAAPGSNIWGGFGVLGGAISAKRVVAWP